MVASHQEGIPEGQDREKIPNFYLTSLAGTSHTSVKQTENSS